MSPLVCIQIINIFFRRLKVAFALHGDEHWDALGGMLPRRAGLCVTPATETGAAYRNRYPRGVRDVLGTRTTQK